MIVANDAPKRPALRYYGGKWKLAPWIISHFPPHKNYVEPCGGAASVLLQKPRSPLETYNDLDGNVVNFFRVLRDQPEELIRKIRLTPWARAEYELSLSYQFGGDEVERARRFAIMQWMAVAGQPSGWRKMHDYRARRGACAFDLTNLDLESIAARLIGVQVESIDALDCIRLFDNDGTLFYFDPPYVMQTRTVATQYLIEVDNDFHIEAAALLRNAQGFVVVSGYACDLYTELYEAHGWHRVDKEAQTNSGGKRIESLWLSPRTHAALFDKYVDMPIFTNGR
jgi:DNA adenine methylase